MNVLTITYFKLTNDLQVLWHGGKTFKVCIRPADSRAFTRYDEVDCFEDHTVKTLEDAKESVENWYTDLVACGEHEEYL